MDKIIPDWTEKINIIQEYKIVNYQSIQRRNKLDQRFTRFENYVFDFVALINLTNYYPFGPSKFYLTYVLAFYM